MKEITSISDLIAEWGTRRLFAKDVGAPLYVVHKWASNNRIPSDWQHEVVRAARRKSVKGISAQWMLDFHKRELAS